MAVVSRLELNHPALGTAGGSSLHASIEALYEKIGDALSSRWFSLADFDQAETVDLDHNFLTDKANLQIDLMNFVGGKWVKLTDQTSPSTADFTIIEKVGDEKAVLQITNDTGGNDLTFAVSISFQPIYLSDGDVKDVVLTSAGEGHSLVFDDASKSFVNDSTAALKLPVGTTAQRPTPVDGHVRYNSDLVRYEGYKSGAWGELGGGGAGGKNYILNPDAAVDATTGVTNTATTGSWTIDRTTTAAELPEETKGTAYRISGSTLTVGDTVEFAIEATGIDDADGGFIARGVIKVLDISGAINGEYKGQFYSVTDSVYVGDEVTITGTGTYIMSVPVIAGNDYEFHLKAATASPTNIGLSGITLEPESPTYGSLGGWKQYSEADGYFTVTGTSWTTVRAIAIPYKDPSSDVWRLRFNIAGSVSAIASTTLTLSGVTFKNTSGFYQALAVFGDASAYGYIIPNTSTFFAAATSGTSTNWRISGDVELDSKPTWADWDNTAPTISDVQYENYDGQWNTIGATITTSLADLRFTTKEYENAASGSYDTSNGIFTAPDAAQYTFEGALTLNGGPTLVQVQLAQTDNTPLKYSEASDNSINFSFTKDMTAGEQVKLRAVTSGANGTSAGAAYEYLRIKRGSLYSARSVSLPFPNGTVRLDTGNGHGGSSSGETEIRNFTNATVTGDAFTYTTRTATTADFITVNRDMVASFTFDDACTTGAFAIGISLNSSQLSTDIDAITKGDRLVAVEQSSSLLATASVTIKLNKGDKIRAHTDGTPNISLGITQFVAQEIYRLGN